MHHNQKFAFLKITYGHVHFYANKLTICMPQNLIAGLEIKLLFREPYCIFKSYLKVLCIKTSTTLRSLQKFKGAPGEFKGALGSRHPLISSPEWVNIALTRKRHKAAVLGLEPPFENSNVLIKWEWFSRILEAYDAL